MWNFRNRTNAIISDRAVEFTKLECLKPTMVGILLNAVGELDLINNYRVARRVLELLLDELDTMENLPPTPEGSKGEGDAV